MKKKTIPLLIGLLVLAALAAVVLLRLRTPAESDAPAETPLPVETTAPEETTVPAPEETPADGIQRAEPFGT